jgi:hypothetical protein
MRTRGEMFKYQEKAAREIVRRNKLAVFLEPGYGKTIITLTALLDAKVHRTLVIAPASVVKTVWLREAAAWEHTRHLRVRPLVGTPSKRKAYLGVQNDIEVVSYENLVWLSDQCDLYLRYGAVVFDELSKMKAPGTKRFKRAKAALEKIPVRVGLTGTPVGNHLLDIWGEMYMVAGEKPLGPTFSGFRSRFFYPTAQTPQGIPVGWVPFATTEKSVHDLIRPHAYVLPPQKEVRIPPVKVNAIPVEMPTHTVALQRKLVDELHLKLRDGVDIEALQASTLATKLRQFASGAVYYGQEPTHPDAMKPRWEPVHEAKLDALEELLDELQGEPLLVFNWYQHEAERIRLRFKHAVDIHTHGAIDAWNARKVELLLAHPASAGHGLNLQHGGHNICWFTLPWSWELWRQANARQARTGQTSPVVTAHVLECGDADKLVLGALTRKGGVEKRLLEGLTG